MAYLLIKENNYAKLFRDPFINVEFMVQTNPDECTRIHQNAIVTTMSRSPQVGLMKIVCYES